jgi:hypothetical protein
VEIVGAVLRCTQLEHEDYHTPAAVNTSIDIASMLTEDDSESDILLPCKSARARKPPLSLPGPGPATQVGDAETQGNAKLRRSLGKQRVHWGDVRTLNDDLIDEPQDVFLQIYNFNSFTGSLGLGIFHVGVELYGCEVWYGSSGVRKCLPKSLDPDAHVRTVPVGQTWYSPDQVRSLVKELEGKWLGECYRILDFNCQTFAHEFCKLLGLSDNVPHEYVKHGDVADWAVRSFVRAMRPISPKLVSDLVDNDREPVVESEVYEI